MNTPQIIWIILVGISLLISAHMHGKPKEGNYNVISNIISSALTFGLLYWGGFFS